MSPPEIVRRIKSYSAATGYVYQYHFQEVHRARRGFTAGNEYVYIVSGDRKTSFSLRIFIASDVLGQWSKAHGRPLTGTEEYAVAKMRLFQAFDEVDDLRSGQLDLVVDGPSLESLLAKLDI